MVEVVVSHTGRTSAIDYALIGLRCRPRPVVVRLAGVDLGLGSFELVR